ncbi:TlpA family protein disulfide reductase [Pedobacter frigoris]|uniref:TlpA family protein disulfide reductase n=1 Tax=Pedobacter frigoris TaxID=2571272 RepID=UPI002930D52E|nr:TlpA family protein disulfide reductase [Pedobacter frigoris]
MKSLRIISVLFMLSFFLTAAAQNKESSKVQKPVRSFTVGDTIPDLMLSGLLNHKTGSTSLSEMRKGKLLILDLFATWCVPCVRALPELNKLQDQFKDELVILPVTYQSKAEVVEAIGRNSNLKANRLPLYVGDSTFRKWFPHRGLPHEVWIDSKGVVIAISQGEEVSAETIKKALIKDLILPVKNDDMNFDISKPLFVQGNGGNGENFLSRSILAPFNDRLSGEDKRSFDPEGNMYRYTATNASLEQLYRLAFTKGASPFYNRRTTVYKDIDTAELTEPDGRLAGRAWITTNGFCYELSLPKALPAERFYEAMMADLNRAQDKITVTIEKRKIECWRIVRVTGEDKSNRLKEIQKSFLFKGEARNVPLPSVISFLAGFENVAPILDETGLGKSLLMDVEFIKNEYPIKFPAIEEIRKCFKRYGLDFIKGEKEMDVMVIARKVS